MENLLNYKNTCINLCVIELFGSNYMKYVEASCFLDSRVRFGYIARYIEENRRFSSGTLAVTTTYGRFISDVYLRIQPTIWKQFARRTLEKLCKDTNLSSA